MKKYVYSLGDDEDSYGSSMRSIEREQDEIERSFQAMQARYRKSEKMKTNILEERKMTKKKEIPVSAVTAVVTGATAATADDENDKNDNDDDASGATAVESKAFTTVATVHVPTQRKREFTILDSV